MAQFPTIRTTSPLGIMLIALALIAGFLFYFQIIKPGQTKISLAPDVEREITKFRTFKDLELNFALFERVDFRSLRIFGEVPVRPSPGGKTDLFSQ